MLRSTKRTFVEGSRTPSRKRGPRRTVHASFPRTRLEHSIKRRTDAGLAVLRKPFANVTLLIHLIAETRALNRGLPVSLKLPRVESQMRACDNCTTRKSASFQIRAKLEPLCNPLQAALRFFRVLIPTCPTASLASRLPWPQKRWRGRTIGLSVFRVEDTSRLGSAYSPTVTMSVCPECQAGHPTACLFGPSLTAPLACLR
jgi:hypothetical protein